MLVGIGADEFLAGESQFVIIGDMACQVLKGCRHIAAEPENGGLSCDLGVCVNIALDRVGRDLGGFDWRIQ